MILSKVYQELDGKSKDKKQANKKEAQACRKILKQVNSAGRTLNNDANAIKIIIQTIYDVPDDIKLFTGDNSIILSVGLLQEYSDTLKVVVLFLSNDQQMCTQISQLKSVKVFNSKNEQGEYLYQSCITWYKLLIKEAPLL